MQKRGISPLIASVLIIGFTVALAAVIMIWGTEFITKTQKETGEKAMEEITLTGAGINIKSARLDNSDTLSLLIENTGDIDFDGVNVRLTGSSGGDVITDNTQINAYGISTINVPVSSEVGELWTVEVIPIVTYKGEQVVAVNVKDKKYVEISSSSSQCQDSDNDGYSALSCGGNDCNDNNANVNPSASEACDGIDNNCDNNIDEGCSAQQCSDGTTYNSCSATKPKYCDNGNLIDDCNQCGCDTGYNCQADRTCQLQSADSSLIGYWKFDEGSGNTAGDFSGNSNDGEINGATWTSNAHSNYALEFNSNYVSLSNNILNIDTSAFSVCLWTDPSGAGPIIGQAEWTAGDYRSWIIGYNNKYSITVYKNGESSLTLQLFSGNYDANQQNFNFVCFTYDQANAKLSFWIDGALVNSGSISAIYQSNRNMCIGALGDLCDYRSFSGIIDEVRIYNKVLSQTEISNLLNQ